MDLSQKTLGAKIAALRKIRNMTQEQLAAQLGISAPAVSKWETGSSYPDIMLLAPLARALGTNLDTQLQFEQSLTGIAAFLNRVTILHRRGRAKLQSLCHFPFKKSKTALCHAQGCLCCRWARQKKKVA